jgi:hypothetical protein
MTPRSLILLAASLALTSCASLTAPIPRPPPNPCQVSAVKFAIGRRYSPELGERAKRAAHSTRLRVYGPDEVVTTEYAIRSLRLMLDADGVIVGALCS